METERKNRIILISVIIFLLITVLGISIVLFVTRDSKNVDVKIVVSQIYTSEYNLVSLSDKYYLGMRDDKINAIIDNEGKEIYKTDIGIGNANWYKDKNNNYIIYTNNDNNLKIYLFDGNKLELINSYQNTDSVKPLLFSDGDNSYIINLVSNKDNNLYIYDLYSEKEVVVKNTLLIADKIKDNVYYTNNINSLVVTDKDLVGAIDLEGNTIIDYKYKKLMNSNNNFIALNNKDLYGVIDKDDKKLLDFNYKVIDGYNNYYLIVNKKNKMALYDKDLNNITDFKMNYNTIIDFDFKNDHSINLYTIGDNNIVINNYNEDKNKTEYEYHNMYVINDGNINNIVQIGFGTLDDLIYSYDKDYNVIFYDNDMNIIGNIMLEDVNRINDIYYVNNDIFCINYNDIDDKVKYVFYNKDFDSVNYKNSNLVYKDEDYIVIKEEDKVIIKDKDDKVIKELSGNNIIINKNIIVVDYDIYVIKKS